MKSFRVLICLLAAIACLNSCKRDTRKAIAVIPKGNAHLFWQSVHAGAVKAARESGVEVVWDGPAIETDYAGQLKIMDTMINRHIDAIALAPIDKKAMVSVVERAAREKIPVVIFDSGVDTDQFVSQVATDNYHAGEMAAERMGKILNGKGKIAMVAVQPGAASTMAREQGFEDVLKKQFPDMHLVDKQFGMADFALSLAKAENILTGHPDLDGLFASNESSTVGAAKAVKERRSKVKLVGFDWSPTLLDDLNAGVIDSLVVQNPFEMGYKSVKAAVAKFNGQPVEKIQNLAPKLIDRGNLHSPDVEAQLHPDLKKYLE